MQVHKNFIFILVALGISGKTKSENYEPNLQDDKSQDYSYSYGVNDIHTGDKKSQWEKKEGDVVTGSYSVAEPDGSIRTVEYTADDKNGFKAVVKYSRPALNEVQKDSPGPSKIQLLDHIDVHPIITDQPILEAQPIKTDNTISNKQYEDKPLINNNWSPSITKPRAFQTKELPSQIPYQNVYNAAAYISTSASNDQQNINKAEPSLTTSLPVDLSSSEQNQDITNQYQYVYPVYQYQHRDTRDSQKYQNAYFQPGISSTRSQRSNNHLEATYNSAPYISSAASNTASGLRSTSDTGNQYQIIHPSYTRNYQQDLRSFQPIQNIIPMDVSKNNLVDSNLDPNQRNRFYPWYKYETPKLHDVNFRPVKFPLANPGISNYGTRSMVQYPININNYRQDQYSNNSPSSIKKQLGSHQQVNVQKYKFARLHPRSSNNREYVKYAKTVTYVED